MLSEQQLRDKAYSASTKHLTEKMKNNANIWQLMIAPKNLFTFIDRSNNPLFEIQLKFAELVYLTVFIKMLKDRDFSESEIQTLKKQSEILDKQIKQLGPEREQLGQLVQTTEEMMSTLQFLSLFTPANPQVQSSLNMGQHLRPTLRLCDASIKEAKNIGKMFADIFERHDAKVTSSNALN
jgi:hypothetical protein